MLLRNATPVAVAGNPGHADALGALIVRNLTPGPGYQWSDRTTHGTSATFAVLAPGSNPATNGSLYRDQPMHQGLNYLTMRDGIQLAATVRYPYGSTCSASAPCPTVIEYSGYNVAGPTDPIPSLLASALGGTCTGCGDANLLPDSATDVGAGGGPGGRVRHRQPPDAGNGVFGRGLRSVRLPLGLRRLRCHRDRGPPELGGPPQGRDGRDQLSRGCPNSRRPAPTRRGWPPSPP